MYIKMKSESFVASMGSIRYIDNVKMMHYGKERVSKFCILLFYSKLNMHWSPPHNSF